MKTDLLIRHEGIRALRAHLSLTEAEKFIALIRREPFDCTEWQQDLWSDKTVDQLFTEAKNYTHQLDKLN
jgi:hypothetical protein